MTVQGRKRIRKKLFSGIGKRRIKATNSPKKGCRNSDKAHGSPGDPAGAAVFFAVWEHAALILRIAVRPILSRVPADQGLRPLEIDAEEA